MLWACTSLLIASAALPLLRQWWQFGIQAFLQYDKTL
jgi:hypothetical protein